MSFGGRGRGSRGRGRGRGGRGGGRRPSQDELRSMAKIQVSGYPDGTSFPEMIEFLNTNRSQPVRWNHIEFRFPTTTVYFRNQRDAEAYLPAHGAHMSNGCKISVTPGGGRGGGGGSSSSNGTDGRPLSDNQKSQLHDQIKKRYSRGNKTLQLGKMRGDSRDSRWINFSNKQFTRELFEFISLTCAEVESVDFTENRIDSLSSFRTMFTYAPHIVNLSFKTNNISSFTELDYLHHYKTSLREIILEENPLQNSCHKKVYHHEVVLRFPRLTMLDYNATLPIIKFDIPDNIEQPDGLPEMKASFYDSQGTNDIVCKFLPEFLQLYDRKSDDLINCYHEHAKFSLTVFRNNASKKHGEKAIKEIYYANSRNLVDPNRKKERSSSIITGKLPIVMAIKKLPPSEHQLGSLTVDANLIVYKLCKPSLLVSFHGNFHEKLPDEDMVSRKFHRSIVLVESTQNPRIPVVVLNDQLHIGPAVLPADAAESGVNPDVVAAKLAQETGVPIDTAKQALEMNSGNFDAAKHAIFQLKNRG